MAGELLVPRQGLNLSHLHWEWEVLATHWITREVQKCYQKSVRGPAACLSEANKQARLVKRKVSLFQQLALGGDGGGH